MARGVNKVILIGNLGTDPEVRYAASGIAVAKFTLATNTVRKDRQTGELTESTEWHRIVVFGRQAEIAEQYLRKGAKLYIEGSLRTSKWQDKSGADRYTTEIVGQEMQMLDGRQQQGGGSADYHTQRHENTHPSNRMDSNSGYDGDMDGPASGSSQMSGSSSAQKAPASVTSAPIDEDDIPF